MRISDWSSDVCSSDLLPKQAKGRSAAAGLSIRVPEQCQPQKSRSGGADVADPAQYGRDPRRENCASRARPRGSRPLVCRTGFARRRGGGGQDWKSVGKGKSGAVGCDRGEGRVIKKK